MHIRHLVIPLVAVAAIAAGCGDDDDAAPAPNAGDTETTVDADAPVEVVAVDYGYENLPGRLPAGATLTLHNDSAAEVHELIAFRLDDTETRSAEEIVALPPNELGAILAGEPDLGLIAGPGEASFVALGDGTLPEPGRYIVFCGIPTGADPDAALAAIHEAVDSGAPGPPHIEGGPPHFTAGMYGELVIE